MTFVIVTTSRFQKFCLFSASASFKVVRKKNAAGVTFGQPFWIEIITRIKPKTFYSIPFQSPFYIFINYLIKGGIVAQFVRALL